MAEGLKLNGVREEVEADVRAAVREFAKSNSASSRGVADMSALVRITATLPLSNVAYWEQLIRVEYSAALRSPVEPVRSKWFDKFSFVPSNEKKRAESGRFLNWIDLVSFDGYIRERTLRTLTGSAPNGFFLAVVLRRMNDWVPQVRLAARDAVLPLVRASNPEDVVDVLCATLAAWISWGRAEMLDKQMLLELLSVEGIAESLKRRLITEPVGPMSTVLSQILRTPVLDEHLNEIAQHAVQPAVRARAQRALLAGKAVWIEESRWCRTDVRYYKGRMQYVFGERPLAETSPLIERLVSASEDRSPIVRRVAVDVLVGEMDRLGSAALPLARRLAMDPSSRVAERAAFVLRRFEAA